MKKKVRITGLPTGQSGLEVKMDHLRAGLGFNSNVMPWPIMAGKMSAPPVKVNSKLKPIPREEANLEAEKDEVAMIPGQGSIPDTYTIGGKRHTQGGTPLNLPENSFIFSDTAKMRIKDPAVLAQFGLSPKKNGYTPAEIAKKYNTAPYKKILADKNTDDLQRETAELMLSNFNLKLGKLALIQESMKGFPQGIPEIAMPYLEAMEINPEDLMQQNPGAPQEGEDAAGQESAMEIGGPVMAQQPGAPLQYLQDGGPDYFAQAGLTVPAAPPEMGGYKSNFPEGFYNYALAEREKLLKGDPRAWNEDPDMKLPDGSLNYCIDCVGNEEIYKNEQNVRDIARLIEEGYSTGTHYLKPQFEAALKQYGIPMPVFNSKGNAAAVPSGAAIKRYGGDTDYFAMGGLKRYQNAGAVKEEPNRYADILDSDKSDPNNPYDFYNLEQRIMDKNKSSEPQAAKKAVEKLDKSIALINSYKETQPQVYKNLLPTLDRLIKSKQQFAEYGILYGETSWDNRDKDAKNFGDPYVHPDIQAASDAYPVTPKDPNALDLSNLPGFNSLRIPGYDTESNAASFSADPETKDAMALYMKGLQTNDVPTLESYAQSLSDYNVPNSWAMVPWSKQNKISDLAQILKERATKIKDENARPDQIAMKKAYKDKANTILGLVYNKYKNAPEGSQAKLDAKNEYDDVLNHLPYLTEPKHPLDSQQNLTGWYGDKIKSTIDQYAQKYLSKSDTTTTEKSPKVNTNVIQAGETRSVPTATMSLAEWKKQNKKENKKEYGGSTKRVRITGLPGMARGGALQKFQDYGQNNNPLATPGTQLNFKDPNYESQAAIDANFGLDYASPEYAQQVVNTVSSEPTKPTNTENKNLAYKDTQVKWKQKTGVSGPATAQGLISGMDFISSLGRNKEMLALEQKMKEKQFSMFTPEAGTKGSWVQSGMASGLINPNSNILQQPGYMTMRRNTFGYGKREFGGAMDQYKWGGYMQDPTTKQWGSIDSSTPNIFVPMTRAEYDAEIAAEKAAGAQAQPSSGSSSGSGASKKGASVASTIGVYTPEWTKYLTELAKSSGMSIDDPRFKAKLPSYFFDDATGKLKSKAELEKLTRTDATQKALKSGAFGDEYWEGAYKDDFVRRHKKLIEKFEAEHPGETFNPTKKDLKGGTESSHMKWFQEEYNKMAKEKGAPTYDFGAPNRFGRLSYSVPSFEDFEEPTKAPGEKPAETQTDKKTTMPAEALKYKHLAEPRINTPAFGWTMQDMNNMGRAVSSYLNTRKQMPWEATPNFYQADTVFDDPTRRIAAMNEQRNIGAQNMAAFTNPQAYMSNFLAANNLGDVANAISDVHSRNINIANQRDAYNAQALNAFDAERANRETRLYDKSNLAQAAYDAEREAKKDVMTQVFNTGMKNAADIYNLNQMRPQFAVTPFTQTMFHSNPRDLKPKYGEEKNLADVYNEILSTHKNLNETAEGRKVALEAAKQQLRIPLTQEDPYLEYQRSRAQSQIPQVNPYADQNV
jgi:hypothetical protein